jgi:hypothetical protein
MSYTPSRGSIAHRAIEHLRHAGGDVALKVLAEAIDTDAQTMRMALGTAVDQGVVSKTLHNGLSWYRIGDGVPLVKDEDTEAGPAGPARNGSQTPDDAGSISGARAGSEPKGLAGTAHGLETAEETTTGRSEAPTAAAQAPVAGDDAKRDGRPASPGGLTDETLAQIIAEVAPPHLAPAPFRCGAFSDGELHIQKAGALIILERFEFETLLGFLNRMCAEGGA